LFLNLVYISNYILFLVLVVLLLLL
jgi:hypothetical protein